MPHRRTAPGPSLPSAFRRTRILIAGCGDVGLRALTQTWTSHARRFRFVATSRRAEQAAVIRQAGARCVQGDLADKAFLRRIMRISQRVIWLAPPTAPDHTSTAAWARASLPRPTRFNVAFTGSDVLAKAQGDSRGHALKNSVTYVSTTGVYGDASGEWITERTPLRPQSDRARKRVAAESAWRRLPSSTALQILRAPGIYAQDRLPVERLVKGLPAIVHEQDSWSNHIHADDLARLALAAAVRKPARLVLNAVDGHPQKMGTYFDEVADALGLQRPPRLPRQEVKSLVSPMMWSFMSESRKIRSDRMARLKVRLLYPSVGACLKQLQR